MKKAAIDFGTTNTVIALWRDATNAPETITLPGLSAPSTADQPALIPSLVYVEDGHKPEVIVGHEVRARGYDIHGDQRYFAGFKRSISAATHPLARLIDGEEWDEGRAGGAFLVEILSAAMKLEGQSLDELVLTVPVHSFERYLKWLRDETHLAQQQNEYDVRRIRIIDESTAAALGYEVRRPGETILVFDFGGGTLDVSLVRMPYSEESRGVVLDADHTVQSEYAARNLDEFEARVIAKSGRILGGDDIDYWLLDDVLARNGLTRDGLGAAFGPLKLAVENAKIRLSTYESAELSVFDPDNGRTYRAAFTRTQFEDTLEKQGFFEAIHRTLDKVLRAARAKGLFAEDIEAVLMVGGSSMIPSVRRLVRTTFGSERVFEHKPFEAVAHGALGLTVGLGVDDFLYHSYGIRHLSPITGRHEWEEIIPAGIRYPLEEPVHLVLTASRDGQEAVELVIGEVEESAGGMTEVMFGNRAILMVEGGLELRKVVPMNDDDQSRVVARLAPPGKAGEDRVEVIFNVDENRTLRVTVCDLVTSKELLRDVPVVELR